jgi:hypothetical protein
MIDLVNMPAAEVRNLEVETLVEGIAQMLYEYAQRAQDAEDEAITDAIKDRYNTKMQTYCAAAEHVRATLRD